MGVIPRNLAALLEGTNGVLTYPLHVGKFTHIASGWQRVHSVVIRNNNTHAAGGLSGQDGGGNDQENI